jgi:hypothetical protein
MDHAVDILDVEPSQVGQELALRGQFSLGESC